MKEKYSKILLIIGILSAISFFILKDSAPLIITVILKTLPTMSMCIWMIIKKLDKINWPIFTGLAFSLLCDVFMALNLITLGMGCNMLALIFYTVYFVKSDPGPDLLKVIPFTIIFSIIYIVLYNNLEENKIPVLIYCILYIVFLWRSSARIGEKNISRRSQYICFAGCASMAISDMILSLTLFNVINDTKLLYIVVMFFWWLGLYLLMVTAELKKQVYLKLN